MQNNDVIPRGNSKQLQAIGNIGLHLSDFETEVCSDSNIKGVVG